MSGSPKIGLFGSKDTTKEVKKEAKDDSDLETYDTEALSIMDINDIIGVQSEPVSDSTLESEIAALSQIITESKMDGIQNVTEEKSETEERGVVEEQGPSKVEDTDVVQTSDTTLDELENICNSEKVCVSNVEQLNQENSQLSSENNVQEKLESNNQQEDNDNCESNVVTYPMSTINVKDSEKVNDTNKTIPVGECTSTLEVIKNEDSVNMPNITQEKKYSESNICGSLQLIGEAYSSEDSQDTNINDIEEKPVDISGNSNENCLSLSESKKETNESYELQNIVNNIVSISDSINSDKICINKDVSVITAEAETHSIEECKKEVDKLEVIQENETVEHCNIEINKEHIESMNEKPIQDGKQEVNLTNDDTETKEHQESECVNVEKEKSHQSVDIHEEIEVNQESKEHMNTPNIENYINDNDTCSVDTHDNTNVTQKENELEIKSTQSHSKSIDDHSVNESQKSTFLPTEDSSEVLETKADMLELPQEKQEIAIEKLEATGEEMQQDSLQTVTGQLISVKEGQCLTANSEKIECTDVNAMELSIAQEKPEKELKTLNSETDTKSETPMEVELNLNSVDCISKSQAIPNDAAPMDTTTTEDNSVNKIDSLEENSEDVIESKEQIKDTINEEIFIVTDIPEECTESKKVEDSEKHIDINLNLPKESKVKNEEEDLKCEHAVETETNELKEDESSSKVDDEESAKELLKEDAVTTLQNEIDTKVDESKDFVTNEDQISDLVSNEKDLISLVSDDSKLLLSEEVTEEETTLGETNVTLQSEDMNATLESEKMNVTLESEEINATLQSEETELLKSEGENVTEPGETNDEEKQENYTAAMDDTNVESLNVEKSLVPNTDTENVSNQDNAEDAVLSKNEELSNKEQIDDNLTSDAVKNNLKSILETATNVEEIFSEEQCQNTQDIVTSILDDVGSATDFKNILNTETNVVNEIENVLQQSADLPLVETEEIEELTEKLPQNEDILNKSMEDSMSTQNIDSLEGLLGLDLIPEGEDSTLKSTKSEQQPQEQETLPKDVDMSLLLEQSNAPDIAQASDYITDVISSCLTDRNVTETVNDKAEKVEANDIDNENVICESIDKNDNVEDLQKQLEATTDLQENELVMDFEETPLESVGDLEETESKLELASGILLQNVGQNENLNDAPTGTETSQPSSEISELESAVKFLQESEEQAIDSPLVLSPKMVESVVNDISKQEDTSSLFVPDEDMCEDASELVVELQDIATDSISISEAEIISEAAKLESERKLAEQVKMNNSMEKFEENDNKLAVDEKDMQVSEIENKLDENMEIQQAPDFKSEEVSEAIVTLPQNIFKASESIPKVSILEERLKEPPKIEIPITDMTKVSMSPTTSKDSLLIQKDAKLIAYQKMLESPKLSEKSEPRIMETPRKDSEKHDFENVGSPRIILKIAKSAITDCGEPRSPKSPKIRSAANSPNPEDSPGQKLGKIKLKLSKGGHPSIISNENIEEAGQWYSEGSSSLSPLGMKIKLSKSGDASIVSSEKHESADDSKEIKHKFEEVKRTESPIGMKIKLSKSGDASIVQQDAKDIQIKHKDKLDIVQGSPKRTESPIGMKIKLSKSGDASIIPAERQDLTEEHRDNTQLKPKERLEGSYDSPKRTDSPIGMKIKLSKSGDASIVSPDMPEDNKELNKVKDKSDTSPEIPKRTESPVGMKIKLSKTKGGASIISLENSDDIKEKLEVPDIPKRTESPLGMKIKLSKSGDASIVHSEISEEIKDVKQKERLEAKEKLEVHEMMKSVDSMKIKVIKSGEASVVTPESVEKLDHESAQKTESSIGMKIKLSKFGDASIVVEQEQPEEAKSFHEIPKRTESPLGMKIKLSKTGDASIIQTEASEDMNKLTRASDIEPKAMDAGLGMKIKLLKMVDGSIVDSEKKERQQRRRDTESPLEMKIKLSKTGHPTIVACENHGESAYKPKEASDQLHSFPQRYKDPMQPAHKDSTIKILKTGHPTILQSNRSELTIEPVQMQTKKAENVIEASPKRKDVTIAPIEAKKSKLETQLTQILPEVTIQPVTREQKQFLFDTKNSAISLQQMNVISQEISITQVRPSKAKDSTVNEKLKDMLTKNTTGSPINSDCEIIEHRPELIIVNENSNSSQDVVIIEEVSPNRMPEVKVPKKRGRPRRNPLPQPAIQPSPHLLMSRDPLSVEEVQQMQQPQVPHFETRENERPKRTCRSQKSYAPPKRGRGRGRGKRKLDSADLQMIKKPRVEQDLTAIEASTTAVITIDESPMQQDSFEKSPELYKALKQPVMDPKINAINKMDKKTITHKSDGSRIAALDCKNVQLGATKAAEAGLELSKTMPKPISHDFRDNVKSTEIVSEKAQKAIQKSHSDEKSDKTVENTKPESKETLVPPGHSNWLTPLSKRPVEAAAKPENMSTVQVIDEETRMSAESNSRSQTPARNISAPASETIVNEESQGSVLSTATTESEKVKVKNRRMEINFDPDEGPFTVDKIAEYEWPLDRKGETFMIQEQISQYLGVKSFKRKYPDLKRRVVDMEERNYLRENGLVSEAMCDMGLTAICSSEVLDVMCSDFPDQYEEYRKHMREKQVKEHSKKQKELTAAANAEKNRIDLAEMAVQSALAWNINLNKARKENRKCSLDLQTFTIHVPKKQQKVEAERKIGHYPVALIPGQYTDYYREYTPAELRYYPLNTVLYGPMRPNERKFDSQSEGSQSDSDSDSSSDDSSSSSSEGTQDTEGSQSTMDDVDMEIVNQKEEIKLKCKMCLKTLNKHSKNEVLIQCGTCNGHVHPSCIDLTLDMVPHIQSYAWQCTDCKTCAQCHDPADEDKMLFCDMCDRGYHIYCVGLRRVPQGRWHCQECAVCANCGSREPGGVNSDRNSVAQWQHEYKKGDKNTRVYVSTLCVPCSKLRGDQGNNIRQEKLSV